MKKIIAILLMFPFAALAQNTAQKQAMDKYVSDLMKKMTLDEKIGQLNLPGAGDITTGQASNSDIAPKIRKGQVG
ncbi:MAG TPA: hypothetical protein PKK69_10470, partial [Ferruginibacter sp.]|nr:hypothetical protein [Ferruginibacter sp.]